MKYQTTRHNEKGLGGLKVTTFERAKQTIITKILDIHPKKDDYRSEILKKSDFFGRDNQHST